MSSLSIPQILHVGLTIVLLNLCLFDCNIYVPVNIRHLVIPFLISVTVDSRVLHTQWVFPIDNESMFRYFNVDLSLASIFSFSYQNSFTAFFTCSFHFSFVSNFNCKSCNRGRLY